MSLEKTSQKVSEFFVKYGQKGFLTLYFSNYLYELVLSYLRAQSDTASKDSGYEFHFGKGRKPRTVTEDAEFRSALRSECDKKASQIVAQLEKRRVLDKFLVDIRAITAEDLKEIESALKEIFEKVLRTEWESRM